MNKENNNQVSKVKTNLFILKNFRKTFKYFIKTIFYNIAINLMFIYVYEVYIRMRYETTLVGFVNDYLFRIFRIFIPIFFFFFLLVIYY